MLILRSAVDQIIAPVERSVFRAGGTQAAAPLWARRDRHRRHPAPLTLLDMVRLEVVKTIIASNQGAAGIYHLLVSWTFTILKTAIVVRVISSWLPISPYSKWVRWSYQLSEPMLAPLRRFVPILGGLDITPILAYILLSIIESFLFTLM